MGAQGEDVVVKQGELEGGFNGQDHEDHEGVVPAIARAQIELGVRVVTPEVEVWQNGEHHEIVRRPDPDFAGLGRHRAAKDRAGDMEAEGAVAQRGTDHPAAHLTDGRVDENEDRLAQGQAPFGRPCGHVGDETPASEQENN